jgi:glycosyltransferase involved in cell wall biosynthesis
MTAPQTSDAPIAYLTSEYPSPSHTFIRREIASLRASGAKIATYSVRSPRYALDNPLESDAAKETFFVLERGVVGIIMDQLAALSSHPIRYLKTLALALRHRVPGLKAFIWALFYFVEAIILARQLKRDNVRHLHNHFANPAANVGLLAKTYLDIPWSLTLHGISEFDYPAGNLLGEKLHQAQFAACVSHFGRAQAMRIVPPEIWPRLHLVRCAIDPEELPDAAQQTKKLDKDRTTRLICVGRLSPEKGHAGLLQALSNLLGAGHNLHLTLVGDGPQEAMIRQLVQDLELEAQVEFAGRLDELSTLRAIASADILVLPSFMEGLPIVLMEALALNVPAIASRVAGIPELIVEGETGLMFDPGHWADLEKALARLSSDKALRKAMAKAGRRKIEAEFAYPAAAEPLLGLFG